MCNDETPQKPETTVVECRVCHGSGVGNMLSGATCKSCNGAGQQRI